MTSRFQKEDERLMFTPESSHFFKMILDQSIRDAKLGIPRKFVEKYRNGMPSLALLEVPSGAVWQVELSKCDGRIWFQKGWQEFAQYYSLRVLNESKSPSADTLSSATQDRSLRTKS